MGGWAPRQSGQASARDTRGGERQSVRETALTVQANRAKRSCFVLDLSDFALYGWEGNVACRTSAGNKKSTLF